jgi:putative transposase
MLCALRRSRDMQGQAQPVMFIPAIHHRRSIRLRGFDYSKPGPYFVTICLADCVVGLGSLERGKVVLTPVGEVVQRCWEEIPTHFGHVALDEFVAMPDHVHGILVLRERPDRVPHARHAYQHTIPGSVGSVVRGYKAAVTRWCRSNGYQSFRWQRDFYEQVVRDQDALMAIRGYIRRNPMLAHDRGTEQAW